jgi:hypothetical protein
VVTVANDTVVNVRVWTEEASELELVVAVVVEVVVVVAL